MDLDARLIAGQRQQQRDDDDSGGSDCRSARPVTPPQKDTRSSSCDEILDEMLAYRAYAEIQRQL